MFVDYHPAPGKYPRFDDMSLEMLRGYHSPLMSDAAKVIIGQWYEQGRFIFLGTNSPPLIGPWPHLPPGRSSGEGKRPRE